MANDALSRRRMLVGAGGAAAAAGATLALRPSVAGAQELGTADARDRKDGLVGTWRITHLTETSESGTDSTEPVDAVVSIIPGGVVITRDINPPGPPGQGVWERTGRRSFAFSFISSGLAGPPEGEGPPPVFILTVTGTGTFEDERVSGTFTSTVTDGEGNSIDSGTGRFEGTRLSAFG